MSGMWNCSVMKLKLHFIHVEPEQFSIAYFAAFRTEAVAIFGLARRRRYSCTMCPWKLLPAFPVRGRTSEAATATKMKQCRSVNINLSIGNATMLRCNDAALHVSRLSGRKWCGFYLGLEPCNRWATQLTSHWPSLATLTIDRHDRQTRHMRHMRHTHQLRGTFFGSSHAASQGGRRKGVEQFNRLFSCVAATSARSIKLI